MQIRVKDKIREIAATLPATRVTPEDFVERVLRLAKGRALEINRGAHFARLCRQAAASGGYELWFAHDPARGVVLGGPGASSRPRLTPAGREKISRGVRLRWQRYREEKAKGAAAK